MYKLKNIYIKQWNLSRPISSFTYKKPLAWKNWPPKILVLPLPPQSAVNEQGVLTDILIELTKNNKFDLKSPAIARHLIIHNNICQFI